MANLTARQVAGIAAQGTPSGTTVAEWVAKAREENASFDPARRGTVDRDDVGLWQVNVRHNADLITEAQVSRENAAQAMTSPLRNWDVTKRIYARQGWQAWAPSGGRPRVTQADRDAAANPDYSTANSGGAVSGRPEEGVEALSVTDVLPDPIADVAAAIREAIEVLVDAGAWVSDRDNWGRVALVVGGGAVAIAALAVLARPVIEPALSAARKVKPL